MTGFHRKRIARLQEDEDATELKLGPEFQNEHCLLYAEVKILMEKLKESSEMTTTAPSIMAPAALTPHLADVRRALGPSFHRTLAYTTQLSKFHQAETIKEVRKVLMATRLEPFEIAQLANLLPEKSDEAKTLIPSIQYRTDDDELQAVLNELQTLKRFQT